MPAAAMAEKADAPIVMNAGDGGMDAIAHDATTDEGGSTGPEGSPTDGPPAEASTVDGTSEASADAGVDACMLADAAAVTTSCDLYLGSDRTHAPSCPLDLNPSIESVTYDLKAGSNYLVNVIVQNHGTASGCSGVVVSLYWVDPTTSYALQNKIGAMGGSIVSATTIPPSDTQLDIQFQWTPPVAATTTNGGHLALVAVTGCTTADCPEPVPSQMGQNADVASPLVAVHDITVSP